MYRVSGLENERDFASHGADLSVGKVGDPVPAQLLYRWDAKNVEQRLVGIHKSALLVGDVNSLFEVLHQLAQDLRIIQASHDNSSPSIFPSAHHQHQLTSTLVERTLM